MKISIIVAMAENRAIGQDNQLLWHLSADLKRFKKITMGHPIIMGRKTFESMGKTLPGRKNIILTKDKNFKAKNNRAIVCHTVDKALDACRTDEDVFVIGGGEIYGLFIHQASRLYITQVHQRHEKAGAYFPRFNKSEYVEKKGETLEEKGISYTYYTYAKKEVRF